MRFSPESLARAAQGRLVRRGSRPIAGAFIDSRAPLVDGLFVPIVAARDGHAFIDAAIAGGATAVLIGPGRPIPDADVTTIVVDDTLAALGRLGAAARDRVRGPVVAITGSNGKTTTRAMIAAVLAEAFVPLCTTRGNLNNHLGVPLTLLGEPHDPAAMVIELGMSAPGENDHLAAIVRPTIAVVTSIALEHLEFMGSLSAIAAAEAEPIAHVPLDGAVIVPGDEPLLAEHLPRGDRPAVRRFAAGDHVRVRVDDVALGVPTIARLAIDDGRTFTVRLRVFGSHNARNAAAAMCVGLELGIDPHAIVAALERVEPVGDRGRVIAMDPHVVIADSYNANPGSVDAALGSLAAWSRDDRPGPRIAVLGDMLELGPDEHELHADVGRRCAALGIDLVITYGPRSAATAAAARDAGVTAVHCEEDIDAVVSVLRDHLDPHAPAAILIKGSRGMRLERVVERLVAQGSP